MNKLDKTLITIDIILTVIYSLIGFSQGISADIIAQWLGSIISLFLIPYFIAWIISRFYKKEKDKKNIVWKWFLKIYIIVIILSFIGTLQKS